MNSSAFLRFQGHSYMTDTHTQKDQSPPETESLSQMDLLLSTLMHIKFFFPYLELLKVHCLPMETIRK